jgi:hypothetical protein
VSTTVSRLLNQASDDKGLTSGNKSSTVGSVSTGTSLLPRTSPCFPRFWCHHNRRIPKTGATTTEGFPRLVPPQQKDSRDNKEKRCPESVLCPCRTRKCRFERCSCCSLRTHWHISNRSHPVRAIRWHCTVLQRRGAPEFRRQ